MPRRERSQDNEIAAKFGARVREVRLDAGMTQEQLAEAASMHATFISNVERGYRVPTVPTLLRLARALNIEPSVLVNDL